jgi:hypothetical protein
MNKVCKYSAILGTLCLLYAALYAACDYIVRHPVHAQEVQVQEVKPYVFADLPHGRIYKTVHEGCELYIVEADVVYGTGGSSHAYDITAGRGCK